ncbi:MAG: hypothetical protein IJO59_05475 [Clostridia bacterium]|nr:hypothetical protein [Clostridia bacterium]
MLRILARPRLWLAAVLALFGYALLAWPHAAAAGIRRGLSVCGGVLIPSLFPFLVLSHFLIRSGVAAALGRRLSPVTRVLFGVSGAAAPIVLLSLIGGYPTGATAVAAAYRNGALAKEEARHLLRFCVCGGPAFIVGAVGTGLVGNTRFGWILFAAHLLAALVIGAIGGPSRRSITPSSVSTPTVSPAAALVGAVTAACETSLSVCGFVLTFSALLSLADACGLSALLGRFAVWLPCLLEVSSGCAAACTHPAAPLILGFALGFGGLSVHCQAAAALYGTDLMSPSFFTARLAHGLLGALFSFGLCLLVPHSLPTFGGSAPTVQPVAVSVPLSAVLFLLCGIWMLTVPPKSTASSSR